MKPLAVNLNEDQPSNIDPGVGRDDRAQVSDDGVAVHAEGELYLPRLLVQVDDGDEDGAAGRVGDGQGDAQERLERLGLLVAPRAGEGRPELGLEQTLDKAFVAT